ncbi:Dual specificity protein phosphatase 9 [Balamuthia mandrillaris]
MPLPCAIAPRLFLGSRPTGSLERRLNHQLCVDRETLQRLGIQHVIVDNDVQLPFEDASGICCLRCAVEDHNSAEMGDCWRACIQYIEEARANGQAVLIQVHGRSRSAAMAVAWAKSVLGLSFEEAVNYVTARCFYKLDTSLMFMEQLHSFDSGHSSSSRLVLPPPSHTPLLLPSSQ